MDTEVFVLCDAATDSQGKLNVLGAFDTIFAPNLPTNHPQCAIAARVRFSPNEGGDHSFQIIFKDIEGKNLLPPFQGNVSVQFNIPDQPARLNIIISLTGIKFEAYGGYTVNLEVDGTSLARIPFLVTKSPDVHPQPAQD